MEIPRAVLGIIACGLFITTIIHPHTRVLEAKYNDTTASENNNAGAWSLTGGLHAVNFRNDDFKSCNKEPYECDMRVHQYMRCKKQYVNQSTNEADNLFRGFPVQGHHNAERKCKHIRTYNWLNMIIAGAYVFYLLAIHKSVEGNDRGSFTEWRKANFGTEKGGLIGFFYYINAIIWFILTVLGPLLITITSLIMLGWFTHGDSAKGFIGNNDLEHSAGNLHYAGATSFAFTIGLSSLLTLVIMLEWCGAVTISESMADIRYAMALH